MTWIKCEVPERDIKLVQRAVKWCKNTIGSRGSEWKHTWGLEPNSTDWIEFYFAQPQDAMAFRLMFG